MNREDDPVLFLQDLVQSHLTICLCFPSLLLCPGPCEGDPCTPSLQAAEEGAQAIRKRSHSWEGSCRLSLLPFISPFCLSFKVPACFQRPNCVCLHGPLQSSCSGPGRGLGLPQHLGYATNGLGAQAQSSFGGTLQGTEEHQLPLIHKAFTAFYFSVLITSSRR